jgi:hypothetical protein
MGRGGRWVLVVERHPLRVELPQGSRGQPRERKKRGVAPLEEREPDTLLYAAWLKECDDETYLGVARRLRFNLDDLPGAVDSAKTKARRYVRRGRAYAAALGIWPWACWPKGVPPSRQWWLDEGCREWLIIWRHGAIERGIQHRLEESALLTRELLDRQAAHVLAVKRRGQPL